MRAILLALCAACVFLTLSTAAGASSAGVQIRGPDEALADRWQGRHHYLYDQENRPGPTTTGASPETSGCATTTVRMRRSDGSSVLRRIRRCE